MDIQLFNWFLYVKFFVSLFAVVNPIGMVPIFISMTRNQTVKERNYTNNMSNIAVMIILSISLFFGKNVLELLGISINSFRIAGGILIITVAMNMIKGSLSNQKDQSFHKKIKKDMPESIAIVPLAMPLIAGPGAISSTIVWSINNPGLIPAIGCLITIALFSFFCWILFKLAPYLSCFLGNTGINIITRVMGLLLMSLGIEFITLGIHSYF